VLSPCICRGVASAGSAQEEVLLKEGAGEKAVMMQEEEGPCRGAQGTCMGVGMGT